MKSLQRLDLFNLALWTGSFLAGSLIIVTYWHALSWPFDGEPYAWGSAHFATIARSYAEQGFAALHGLPVGNNPPLGIHPDAYVRWAPLFTMLLGIIFKLFGVSEGVARGFMLAIGAAVVASTGWVAKLCFGSRGSAVAIFGVLTTPVFFLY